MIRSKLIRTKTPRYITQASRMDVDGFLLTATFISLIPENTEHVYRFENGVHIWEPKEWGASQKDQA